MSGCLGAGASLQQFLRVWVTGNMADAREVRMLQRFLRRYSPLGVVCQQRRKEINPRYRQKREFLAELMWLG